MVSEFIKNDAFKAFDVLKAGGIATVSYTHLTLPTTG